MRARVTLMAVVAGVVAALASAGNASAAAVATPLKLKTDWAHRGIFTLSTHMPGTFEYVTDCTVTGTQKLVALAQSRYHSKTYRVAFKLDKHGKLVRNSKGRRYVGVGSSSDKPITTMIDSNGHVYFAFRRGTSQTVYLSRTKTDLSADKRFGRIALPAPLTKSGDFAFSDFRGVRIFPHYDGGVLVAVQTGSDSSALTRIGPNGKIDPTFGTGGTVTYPAFVVRAIDAKGNGPVYLGGVNAAGRAQIQRIEANGAQDTDYATGGTADVGGTSVSSRIDGAVAQTGGSLIVKRFRRELVPGQPPTENELIVDVTRVTPSGALDDQFPHAPVGPVSPSASHSVVLLDLGPGSDNAPDLDAFPLHAHGDAVFTGYFASRLGSSVYGSYYWLNSLGHQLGFPKSTDSMLNTKSPIYTVDAIPAIRGGFYACGAVVSKKHPTTHAKIAIARYKP